MSDALGPASSGFARSTVCVDQVIRKASKTIGRFSNFFQKKYSKRDQPYSQAANPFGQYIGLSGLSLIPHFCLLFLSILLTTSHLFIMNFTNEGGLIIMTLIVILISSWTAIAAAPRYTYVPPMKYDQIEFD